MVPRVRKASKERSAYKGRWARPALGEKRENLVRRGFREKLVLRVRKASKERSAYKGRWARPAPGEKRESLVRRDSRESLALRVRKAFKMCIRDSLRRGQYPGRRHRRRHQGARYHHRDIGQ